MKNKEQFDNSIKVLVKAYLEGVLLHSDVCACAVGNLIADGMGYKVAPFRWEKNGVSMQSFWYSDSDLERIMSEINSTGYTKSNIWRIERAFESGESCGEGDADGYKGLCAVFDVLIDIHKGSDKQLKLAKDKLLQL